jgi:hypothetical protein
LPSAIQGMTMSARKWVNKWWLSLWEAILYRRLIGHRDNRALTAIVSFTVEHARRLRIDKSDVREAIFNIDTWGMEQKYEEQLFSCVETYLCNNVQASQGQEWHVWVRQCRNIGHRIDVMKPMISKAILASHVAGNLVGLPTEDEDYLLDCYLSAYQDILVGVKPKDQYELLPVLFEFATIAQLVGPQKANVELLKRWTKYERRRPQPLTEMSNAQAFNASIHGVGSPHRVCVTRFRDLSQHEKLPTIRLSYAGATGDAAVNSQIFSSLFAAALLCDIEPTFVTLVGCTLSVCSRNRDNASTHSERSLLDVRIGPVGPIHPAPAIPSLGMDAQEAMDLLSLSSDHLQLSTSLVAIKLGDIEEAYRLETRVVSALQSRGEESEVIRSDVYPPEETGMIHVMPLLHRDVEGKAVPLEIEIPYHLLGSERVFDLLRISRKAYMQQLISAGHRRRGFAQQVYEEEAGRINAWESRNESEREAESKKRPQVRLNIRYDFKLGIPIPLPPSEQILVSYEEFMRSYAPPVRDKAKWYAERFAVLCDQLEGLSEDGGKADILTFKLLFDSMLRKAQIPIAHAKFQEEYRHWIELRSDLVWKALVEWARHYGIVPDALAADNVIYNAVLDADRTSILVQPWVMIDLHDFVLRIDHKAGVMQVYPGGGTPILTDQLKPVPTQGIMDLPSLYNRFSDWLKDTLGLQNARDREELVIRSEILAEPIIGTLAHALIQLKQAKQQLYHGEISNANLRGERSTTLKIIDSLGCSDLAAVYFWGAVAHQYDYLDRRGDFAADPRLIDSRRKRIAHAILKLIVYLSKLEDNSSIPSIVSYGIDEEAQQYIGQLRALAEKRADGEEFVRDLLRLEAANLDLEDDADVEHLRQYVWRSEMTCWRLSQNDSSRFEAAVHALSSFELLDLAEDVKRTATKLPFLGAWNSDLREEVETILNRAYSLDSVSSTVMREIEDLASLLSFVELDPHTASPRSIGHQPKLQFGGSTALRQFDIYLGYNRNDTSAAIELAQKLEDYGFSVWKVSRDDHAVKLRRAIAERFDLEELRTLCFDLKIDYDNLPGEGKSNRARELVAFLNRCNRIPDLISYGKQHRPDVVWGDLLGETGYALYEFRGFRLEEFEREINKTVKAVMMVVGPEGIGPWDLPEVHKCLSEFSRHSLLLFLSQLPGAPDPIGSSTFLKEFVQIDLRSGINREALILLFGRVALETSRELAIAVTESRIDEHRSDSRFIDTWGIATIKSRLHALAELIAREAAREADMGAATYQRDALTIVAPLVVDFRWERAYASGLKRLLSVPTVHLRDFHCTEATPPCAVTDGWLSAKEVEPDQVLILLDDNPAVIMRNLASSEVKAIKNAVNHYGRLAKATTSDQSLRQRISDLRIPGVEKPDALREALKDNQQILIPLIARFGLRGLEWLLPNDEEFPEVTKRLLDTMISSSVTN